MSTRFLISAVFVTYSGRRVNIKFTAPYQRVGENEYRKVKEQLADEWSRKTQGINKWTRKGDPIVGCDSLTLKDDE